MNFEDVDLDDINSVGQYIMSRDYNLGLMFYNFPENDAEDINNAIMVCALRIMHFYMTKDIESEQENVDDWFEIMSGTGSDNDRETYEVFRDSLEQDKDELHEVEEKIDEYQGGKVFM